MYNLAAHTKRGSLVRLAIFLALCLMLAILLAACSSTEEEEPAPAGTTAALTATDAPPTATPAPPTATAVPAASEATPTLGSSIQADGADFWPTDGWRSSTPEEQGMDSERLAQLFDYIQQHDLAVHSVTIIRDGYIVANAAICPFDKDSKHNLKSATKSVSSALTGIAVEQGYIDGLNLPVLSFFPDRTVANVDANKEAMTLEHLLTMATGLECRDSWKYRWRGMERMMQTDDWVQYVLDLPMIERPGTRFEYCNGASFLLSAIIQETSGMTTAEFAEVHLFASLGIDDVIWPDNPQGITLGYGEMRLQPHDMAKIGHLYLKDGQWDSNEIIPASWLAASTFDQIRTGRGGYGYQWWIDPDGVYNALGYAGQYILVVPEIDLVAVFTGNLNEDDSTLPRLLLDIFVIRAAKSSEALPANPDGVGLLESSIQAAASAPAEPEPAAPLPEVARRISGTTYLLDTPNPSGLASISLSFGKGAEALMKLAYVPEDTLMNGEESPVPVQAEVTLGLDNVYRFSPGFFGMKMGAKGE